MHTVTMLGMAGCLNSLVNVPLLCPCIAGWVSNPCSRLAGHARESYGPDTHLSSLTCYPVQSDPRGPLSQPWEDAQTMMILSMHHHDQSIKNMGSEYLSAQLQSHVQTGQDSKPEKQDKLACYSRLCLRTNCWWSGMQHIAGSVPTIENIMKSMGYSTNENESILYV